MSIGWLIVGIVTGVIFCVLSYLLSLATRRPDFEIDDSEEFSGVYNVRENNKAHHNVDTYDGVRNRFDDES